MGLKVWTIKDIVYCLEQMQGNKFDCIMVIEGNRGLGKSTLGVKILSRVKCKNPFNMRKDIAYKREDVIQRLAVKKHGSILADELINVAFNRDYYQEDQKILLKAFNMYRDHCNIFIGCVPKFSTIDNQIQQLCKLRLTVVRRGFALVQMPKQTINTVDRWDIKYNQKIEEKWGKRGFRYPKYNQLSTVVGIIRFGDLTKKQRRLYEKVKKAKRNKIFKDYEGDEGDMDQSQQFYNRLMERIKDKKLTSTELYNLCYISNRKYKTVREKLNRMLKEAGDTATVKDYVSNNNVTVKKSNLGFKIG